MPLFLLLSVGAGIGSWLREGRHAAPSADGTPPVPHHAPWYATLWLTGVDYFSSLGYAPGLAVLAAGFVAPVAMLLLVLVTFLAAVPVYAFVAKHSSEGEGSIKMIERMTGRWGRMGWFGKTIVLILIGFAMTDFIITITLSSADATHHVLQNPLLMDWIPHSPVLLTALLIIGLGLVFLKGFKEAIWICALIAIPYMALNAVIIWTGFQRLSENADITSVWWAKVTQFDLKALQVSLDAMSLGGAGPVGLLSGGGPLVLVAVCLLVFPKLALGMSGFETGVSVMPHISGKDTADRVRNTRKMLIVAATLMSVALLGSVIVTTLLIPEHEFRGARDGLPAGKAAGRALAYLAHDLLGPVFGTVYDFNTLAILWFAGASAMAGLLNIIPRYLPRFGMSPAWLEFRRPLVLVLTSICLVVNWFFQADVEAQGGAYATGVLVLMASGAFAVLLAERENKLYRVLFSMILAVFLYVLVVNAAERPDGLKIAGLFILGIIVASVWSRWRRSHELRVGGMRFEDTATERLWGDLKTHKYIVLIPLRSRSGEARRTCEARRIQHQHASDSRFAFLHVNLTEDPSQFASPIRVKMTEDQGDYIVEVSDAVAVANAIAYVALELEADEVVIGLLDSGTPVLNAAMYLLFGTGEVGYAVRAIFVRIREERLAEQFLQRSAFDDDRDRLEKAALRDVMQLDPEQRHARMLQLFEQELVKFESQVPSGPKLPRLILFD